MNLQTTEIKKGDTNIINGFVKLKGTRKETGKLKCVAIDDDPFMLEAYKDLCDGCNSIEMIGAFTSPKEFLSIYSKLDFDFCLLDIYMPEMNGILLAQILKGKSIVFVTGNFDNMKEALEVAPVDIIPKPVAIDRFEKAIHKVHKLLGDKISKPAKEFDLFNIAESDEKKKIYSTDIYFVRVDDVDPRNKRLITRLGEEYTLMDCTFGRLMGLCSRLIQVNKAELISLDAVYSIKHDLITLVKMGSSLINRQVTLSYTYRKEVLNIFR